ncbi:MAG: hypothetical protein DHS20C02_02220 [Micavibrio sp.]|nr:MAG: hypothetical protein DHS20C02_02220 [Micavibrio sp.]
MNLIKASFLVLFVVFVISSPVMAQEADDASFDSRLELAEKMQALNPARAQVSKAIEKYVASLPAKERDVYRAALGNIINYKALEKISVDAYAETFTEAELAAMVEYYSKPEAVSARDKHSEWGKKVYPEIIRMLDKAMMRVKTGGEGP